MDTKTVRNQPQVLSCGVHCLGMCTNIASYFYVSFLNHIYFLKN